GLEAPAALLLLKLAYGALEVMLGACLTYFSFLFLRRLDANLISEVPEKSFEGLPSLRHLWLDDNALTEIPVQALNNLPALQAMTLALNQIWHIPDYAFQNLSSLVVLHLHNNRIQSLGTNGFEGLHSLETLGFHNNNIKAIPEKAFAGNPLLQTIGLPAPITSSPRPTRNFLNMCLPCRDLSWNYIQSIHPDAFVTLHSLVKLDLTENQLVTLPLAGLGGLTHLKLKGNSALSESFTKENFPNMRVLEVPYAYQCCAYGACSNFFKVSNQWEAEGMSPEDEDDRALDCHLVPHSLSGPFKPCNYLFESWVVRLGIWVIVLVSVLCNGLVMVAIFTSPGYLSPIKFVIGSIAGANVLTGAYCAILAFVDALTFGHFATYGARWEMGTGCRVTGFLSVFASEASILLLTLAAVQCSISVSCVRAYGKAPSFGSIRAGTLCCLALSSVAAALPLFSVGEYGASPLCLPYPLPDGKSSTLGFMVALVMVNTLCFLIITGTYIRLYCNLLKGEFDSVWDCAMIKHVAWLIFSNCLLYCPVAFLTFSSMLSLFLVTPEVIKSVLLVVLPLPACVNPLLYLLFNPHFRDDLRLLRQRSQARENHTQSYVSEDTEKSSYDSTQALVAFSDIDHIFEASDSFGVPPGHPPVLDAYSFPSVMLIPCQQRALTRGLENGFSAHHSCPADDELLITSENRDSSRSSLRVALFPAPSVPAFTSHL
uniref:Leucine rich repeat containing G protein-coupled receptor 6 n=1 Tax=Sphenodon punctatus TaxID=8508 RepID=A0A8D0GUB6_SPHPU